MIIKELAEILQKNLGLNISSIGACTLERSVNKRVKELDLANQVEYVSYVRSNPSEISQLIDEVVIPETWFFRDTAPFIALRDIANRWYQKRHQRDIRILSIPCASGEEPYSIAMTMLDAGWPSNSFHLDAVDVSTKIIDRAKRATYSKNSFRNIDLSFRDKYFTKNENLYVLEKDVAATVRFQCGNILDLEFMARLGLFDIIFCRNILYYLDRKAQQLTVRKLAQLLQPEGYLFVGAAEAIHYLSEGFIPYEHDYGQATILHHKNRQEKRNIKKRDKSKPPRNSEAVPTMVGARNPEAECSMKDAEVMDAKSMLAKARQLADEGRLKEAQDICQNILQRHGPAAEVYYLLAILHDFLGQLPESVKLLKKALYLLPDHEESLLLLIFMSERLGDKRAAINYKRRLNRLKKRGLNMIRPYDAEDG
ncbi:MAG: protein-glutamate O-methyltransferase CheR [Deltaproteobacteria bacterium]